MWRDGHVRFKPKDATAPNHRRRRGRRYGARKTLFNAALGLAVGAAAAAGPAFAAAGHVPIILDFGDSLTAGYGLMPEEAFPARLEAWLHAHGIVARVINAGVSGDTTADGVARLDWALADRPDLVILALGANDALRGIDPATVRANIDRMLQKIAAANAKVLILGMRAPPNWGESYERAFDRVFPEVAQSHHAALYPFLLEGVAMKPEFNQADGLHPNERGVAVLVSRIGPVVTGLLTHQGGAS